MTVATVESCTARSLAHFALADGKCDGRAAWRIHRIHQGEQDRGGRGAEGAAGQGYHHGRVALAQSGGWTSKPRGAPTELRRPAPTGGKSGVSSRLWSVVRCGMPSRKRRHPLSHPIGRHRRERGRVAAGSGEWRGDGNELAARDRKSPRDQFLRKPRDDVLCATIQLEWDTLGERRFARCALPA